MSCQACCFSNQILIQLNPPCKGFKQSSAISDSQARFRNMWSFMCILLLKRKRGRPSSLAFLAIAWKSSKYFKPCAAISLAFAAGIHSGARYIFGSTGQFLQWQLPYSRVGESVTKPARKNINVQTQTTKTKSKTNPTTRNL